MLCDINCITKALIEMATIFYVDVIKRNFNSLSSIVLKNTNSIDNTSLLYIDNAFKSENGIMIHKVCPSALTILMK